MKKPMLFLLILFIYFLPTILTEELSCQYTETKEKQERVTNLYYTDSGILAGNGLGISNIIKGNISSFDVYNHFSYSIDIKFFYSVIGYNAGSKEYRFKIEPLSTGIVKEYCVENGKNGPCEIVVDTIKYEILKPTEMYSKKEVMTVNKTECKICPTGNPCKNDGEMCNNSNECGIGKCNIAEICAVEDKCPEGTKDCNNESCLKPSVKKKGEAYSCEWECESNRGKDGICKMSLLEIVIWIVSTIIFLLLCYLFYDIVIPIIKRKNLEEDIKNLRELRYELQELEKIKGKSIIDMEREKELKDQIIKKQREIEENEDNITKPYHSKTRAFFEWKNPNIKNQYYPCYVNKDLYGEYTIKTDVEIHKDLAEKEIFNQYRDFFKEHYPTKTFKELLVHHIDKDIFNYDLQNLIIISRDEHDKINHGNIKHGDWKSGIQELKRLNLKSPHISELNT